jgi:cyclophilin family peptidyl-prolyl cis-trans isomerase
MLDASSTVPEPIAQATSTLPNQNSTTTPIMSSGDKLAFPGIFPEGELANKQVRVKTDKGEIVFELLPKEGPKAASNFYYLVNRKFYDGLTFHRVEPGFVVQGGDPLGNGTGGPGYQFGDDPVNLPYNEGIVAMANAGPNTNGSQFFIMLANTPLPPQYSIFGRVVSGMDVVKKISVGDKMTSVTIEPLKK